jgi:DNA-directed RNA polymerase specialized sigma24 family protein
VFFGLLVVNAIRNIRARYTPPGQATRQRRKAAAEGDDTETETASEKAGDPEKVEDTTSFDAFAVVEAQFDAPKVLAAAERFDAAKVLAGEPSITAKGLRLVYLLEMPIGIAAAQLGVSRFKLRR